MDSYTARIEVMSKFLAETGPFQKLIHSNVASVPRIVKRQLLNSVHPQPSAIEILR